MSGVAAEVRSRANGRSFDVDSAADPVTEGASGGQSSVREPESFQGLGGKKREENEPCDKRRKWCSESEKDDGLRR